MKEKINSSKTKDIRIAIPCPWGPTLRFIELKDWVDCDVHEWLSMTHLVVTTSKENYSKQYRFKIVPII
jgi:hypothetical protein